MRFALCPNLYKNQINIKNRSKQSINQSINQEKKEKKSEFNVKYLCKEKQAKHGGFQSRTYLFLSRLKQPLCSFSSFELACNSKLDWSADVQLCWRHVAQVLVEDGFAQGCNLITRLHN